MTQEVDLLAGATKPAAADPLAELVGEGKKFKDVAALAAGKVEADKFITQLQGELAGLRKELEGKAKAGEEGANIQALIERIEKATAGQNGNQPGTLSREEVEKLVKDGMTLERSEASRRTNYTLANAELLNHFKGDADQASQHLKARVSALGLSGESLTEIASSNPKMFRELFVPQPKAQTDNGAILPPGKTGALEQGGERGKSYYSKLRKEMGNKFWDVSIQQQMFRDRMQLGDKFNAI